MWRNMVKKEYNYGICGVYCGQCPDGNGRVQFFAQELKRLVDTVRFDWMEDNIKSFRFSDFRRGLEWFANNKCPMCLNGGGKRCKNKKCAKEKGMMSCLLCQEYLECENTEYQRETYPFVTDNYERVKEIGLEKHLEEESEKTKAGVDLMGHLERRCCKVVKLD